MLRRGLFVARCAREVGNSNETSARVSVQALQVGLDPGGAGFRREEAFARVVFEREAAVGRRAKVVGERDERAGLVAAFFQKGPDAAHPEERERLVVAARGRRAYAVRGVVAPYPETHARDGLGPVVLQEVPERDGQVRRVRPLVARQRAVVEAAQERKDFARGSELRRVHRQKRHLTPSLEPRQINLTPRPSVSVPIPRGRLKRTRSGRAATRFRRNDEAALPVEL